MLSARPAPVLYTLTGVCSNMLVLPVVGHSGWLILFVATVCRLPISIAVESSIDCYCSCIVREYTAQARGNSLGSIAILFV